MKVYVIRFSDDLAYVETITADSDYDLRCRLYGIDRNKIYYDLGNALEKVYQLNSM